MSNISLYNRYKEQSLNCWKSYYDIKINPHKLFSKKSSYSLKMCRGFIRRHYQKGKKGAAIILPFKNEYEQSDRHVHMTSLYLLGVYLESLFCQAVETEFERNIPAEHSWFNFLYTWFLTCLYHDTASCIESYVVPSGASERMENFDFNKNSLSIKHTPYNMENLKYKCVIYRGSDDLAKNYFNLRLENNRMDHGIISGYLLYDRLLNNFKNATSVCNWNKDDCFVDNKRYLLWRLDHIDHFSYIADAIICHNMWTVQASDEKNVKLYRKNNLDDLIISNDDDKLSINSYPLQFMLCLLDSIEPVKRFRKLSARDVLENISIEKTDNNQIIISWSDKIKNEHEFWEWMKNISSLEDWMKVKVSPCRQENNCCYVTINIR